MKRTLLTFCILQFVFCASFAQLNVTDFRIDERDSDGRANFPKYDVNNNLMALIKIETSLSCDGFTNFNTGANGFGDAGDCNLGTWVYVVRGSQKISITHKDGGTLVNYFFPTVPVGQEWCIL